MNIWPWSKINKLEEENKGLRAELALHKDELLQTTLKLSATRSLIRRAHFRNPKTGRIGRKGQIFNV